MDKSLIAALILFPLTTWGQTHTMPGSNVVPSGATLTISSGGTINAAAGSTVTGFGSGGAPTTATYITQTTDAGLSAETALSTLATGLLKSTTTTGALTTITDNSTNWNTAFTQTRQWDGGSTGLVAATGRASLGLVLGTDVEVPLTFSQSLLRSVNTVTLSGDSASPGNTMLYGTNGSGTKGWYAQPVAGGNVGNTGTPVDNQLAIWTNSTTIEGDSTLTYTGGASGVLKLGGTDLGLSRNAAGVLEVDNGTAGQWGALKVGVRDASTNTVSDAITFGRQLSAATPAPNFGTGILFNLNDSTTADVNAAHISAYWSVAAHATRSSVLKFQTADSLGFSSGVYLFGSNGFSVGNNADPGASIINASGYKAGGSTPAIGTVLQSNGTSFGATVSPAFPTSVGSTGYTPRSDGSTGYSGYPAQLINSSVTSQSPTTSDVYLTGSNIVVTAGDMKAKGQYKCVFDMTKSTGTGAIVITLRVGTLGTTSDAAIQTYTFGAGTSVADFGLFEVIATWRTVGSGTSAVMQGMCRGTHQLATTGLFNNAAGWMVLGSPSPSSGFNSSTATNIGISFNGSTAFAGTTQVVQAQLQQ